MTGGVPVAAARPATQLPQGRYPASAATVWAVVGIAVALGLTLAVAVPAVLATDTARSESTSLVGEQP